MKRAVDRIVTILIAVFFVGSLAFLLCKPQSALSEMERRALQERPKFSLESVWSGEYMKKFEAFASDQFYGRGFFVSTQAQTEKLLGKQENNGVYLAEDDYLIGRVDAGDYTIADANLDAVVRLAESVSIPVGAVICPPAETILPEKLPNPRPADQGGLLMERIADRLAGTRVQWADVRGVLEHAAGRGEQVFYRTDHHETSYGAFLIFNAWAEQSDVAPLDQSQWTQTVVSSRFLGTLWSKTPLFTQEPDEIVRWDRPNLEARMEIDDGAGIVAYPDLYAEEYLNVQDQYSYFLRGNHALVRIYSNANNGEKLLVLKDSYAHTAAPFFADSFSEVHMMDLRYFRGRVIDYIEENGIDRVLFFYSAENFARDATIRRAENGLDERKQAELDSGGEAVQEEKTDQASVHGVPDTVKVFSATVLEAEGTSLLVRPDPGSPQQFDTIRFILDEGENRWKPGDRVNIAHTGEYRESDPPLGNLIGIAELNGGE